MGIILVPPASLPLQNNKGTPSAGALNRGRNNLRFLTEIALCLETVRDRHGYQGSVTGSHR